MIQRRSHTPTSHSRQCAICCCCFDDLLLCNFCVNSTVARCFRLPVFATIRNQSNRGVWKLWRMTFRELKMARPIADVNNNVRSDDVVWHDEQTSVLPIP